MCFWGIDCFRAALSTHALSWQASRDKEVSITVRLPHVSVRALERD